MRAFPFKIQSILSKITSGWSYLTNNSLLEGIRFSGNKLEIDFNKDEPGDVVNLETRRPALPKRRADIPVFRGYKLENVPTRKEFMETVKKWGALDEDNLKALIDLSYPTELSDINVELIFITGSSEPLSANIAKSLKELYYPNAKIIDITKKYYGADINDVIDWDAYEKADPKTQQMIDSYLRQFKYGKDLSELPRNKFEGFIKKSSGLQSGARRLLNPGHDIDDVIIGSILKSREDFKKWFKEEGHKLSYLEKTKKHPRYLVVDETMIEGSTLRGIFKHLLHSLQKPEIASKTGELQSDIYGYVLFSY